MTFYCPACEKRKARKEFHADRSKSNNRSTYCRTCENTKAKQRRQQNPENDRAIRKRSYEKHKAEKQAQSRAHYYTHQKDEQRKARERYHQNPGATKERHRRMKLQALRIVSAEVKCRYCEEVDPSRLEIDHVNGDGQLHRVLARNIYYLIVRDGLPTDTQLQILCEKHNAMKSWLPEPEFKTEIQNLYVLFFGGTNE